MTLAGKQESANSGSECETEKSKVHTPHINLIIDFDNNNKFSRKILNRQRLIWTEHTTVFMSAQQT